MNKGPVRGPLHLHSQLHLLLAATECEDYRDNRYWYQDSGQ